MAAKTMIWLTVFILFLATPVMAATLHGTIYDIELKEMNGVVVTVDSTPQQRYVSKDGMYSFELNPGRYELAASYTLPGCVEGCNTSETVMIEEEGDYVFDLFLFPDIDADDEELLTESYAMDAVEGLPEEEGGIDWYVAVVLAVAIIIALIVYLYLNAKTRQLERDIRSDEAVLRKRSARRDEGLDEDLSQVLDILRKEGGRTTQKELRRQIPLSEAKISLMVAELEAKGKIEKIKKGRGNIIKLGHKK